MAANNQGLALLTIEDEKSINSIMSISKILKHKGKKKIIDFLVTNGPANVTTIYVKLRMQQSVVSQFFRPMRKFGMVNIERIGKEKHYSVNIEILNTYINYLNNAPKIKETSIETK